MKSYTGLFELVTLISLMSSSSRSASSLLVQLIWANLSSSSLIRVYFVLFQLHGLSLLILFQVYWSWSTIYSILVFIAVFSSFWVTHELQLDLLGLNLSGVRKGVDINEVHKGVDIKFYLFGIQFINFIIYLLSIGFIFSCVIVIDLSYGQWWINSFGSILYWILGAISYFC